MFVSREERKLWCESGIRACLIAIAYFRLGESAAARLEMVHLMPSSHRHHGQDKTRLVLSCLVVVGGVN